MTYKEILELRRQRAGLAEEAGSILDTAKTEQRDLTGAENARFDALHARVEKMGERIQRAERQADVDGDLSASQGVRTQYDTAVRVGHDGFSVEVPLGADGRPVASSGRDLSRAEYLEPGEKLADWIAARGGRRPEKLGLRHIIQGLAGVQADPEAAEEYRAAIAFDREQRFMATEPDSAGGHMVPATVAAQIIDLARSRTVVLQAGGRTVPMLSKSHSLPTLEKDPTPFWRTEGAAFTESDAEVGARELVAKGVGFLTLVTEELIQDSAIQVEQLLTNAIGAALAVELDRVMLLGDGTGGQPQGLFFTPGLSTTPLTAAPASYDFLLDRMGEVEDANYQNIRTITSPRVGRQLAALKDTTEQPLMPPQRLQNAPILESTIVPTDLGVGTNESLAFVGSFGQLVLGTRLGLTLKVLRERYADEGKIGVWAFARVDVAVARTNAFSVATEILPTP